MVNGWKIAEGIGIIGVGGALAFFAGPEVAIGGTVLGVAHIFRPRPVATNSAYLNQTSDINLTSSCSAQGVQVAKDIEYDIDSIKCKGGIDIGGQVMNAAANCNNQQSAAAIARTQVMQDAETVQQALGLSPGGSSNNSLDLIQTQAETLTARCSGSYNQHIENETFKIGDIESSKACNIGTQNMNQQFACIQGQQASIDEDAEANQTAKSVVKNNLWVFILLAVVFAGMAIIPELMLTSLLPKGGESVPDTTVPDLEMKCGLLKGQVATLQGQVMARSAATPSA